MEKEQRYGAWDDRRQSLIAALPPLILGLGIALRGLITLEPWYELPVWRLALGVAAALAPAAVIAVGGLIALWRRLPDWGYTWLGASLMLVALLLNVLAEERAEVGKALISPAGDVALTIVLALAGLAVLIWTALRGWRQAGLVSIGLATTMGLSVCGTVANAPFNRYDLTLLAAPLGLLFGALTVAFARGSTLARLAVLAGVGLANAGAALMCNEVTRTWLEGRQRPSFLLPLLVVLTGALLAGPALGALAQPLQRIARRAPG